MSHHHTTANGNTIWMHLFVLCLAMTVLLWCYRSDTLVMDWWVTQLLYDVLTGIGGLLALACLYLMAQSGSQTATTTQETDPHGKQV